MEERISRGGFIKLGTALGVGAAGASILAACSGAEKASSPTPNEEAIGRVEGATETTQGGGTTVAQVEEGTVIAREADVPPGSVVECTDEESAQQAVLVHLESGDFVAYSAICTHRGCTVNYRDGKLACPCHDSVFDPARAAAVKAGPAPLPEIPIEVRNVEVVRA